LAQVVEAIAAQNFDHPVTAGELVNMAEDKPSWGATEYTWPELHDALMEAVGDRNGSISSKSLGRWLDRHAGRVVGGYKIVKRHDPHLKQHQWSLEKRQK
jgi:hypothetical protein